MPRRIVLSLLICLFISAATMSSQATPPLHSRIKTALINQCDDMKYNATSGSCLLILMFLLSYQAQPDRMSEDLSSQFKPKNLALNFASTYGMNFACQFFHELGHGLAKKILARRDFKIHLGKGSTNKNPPLIDSKYISLDGFDPILGFNTALSGPTKKYNSMQKIFINLAGGLSGIIGYYLLRTLISFGSNLHAGKNDSAVQCFKNALLHSVTIDQIVVSQLFNMFIPMGDCSDAVKVWQELGVKNSSIKTVADLQPYLAMLAHIALAFKQANSGLYDKRHASDKVLIGLSNFFLHGFMQFKSA